MKSLKDYIAKEKSQTTSTKPSESQRQASITKASRQNTESLLPGLEKAAKEVTAYN